MGAHAMELLRERAGPCRHAPAVIVLEVLGKSRATGLRRHGCDLCHRSWWERDGTVIEVPEALQIISEFARAPGPRPQRSKVAAPDRRPRRQTSLAARPKEPAPAAFLALLAWVGQVIGTEHVVFATAEEHGWQVMSPLVTVGNKGDDGTEASVERRGGLGGYLADERLLDAVAALARPGELPARSLAATCPDLVADGARHVVGAPLYGPVGELVAVIVVAYPWAPGPRAGHTPTGQAWAGPETVSCMGKLLATAFRRMRALSPPGPPPGRRGEPSPHHEDAEATRAPAAGRSKRRPGSKGLLTASQVANMFAVSPRTINNWVTNGTLPAVRTAGGHLRVHEADAIALLEGLPASTRASHARSPR
jgi:excisionase family DNA binding protein